MDQDEDMSESPSYFLADPKDTRERAIQLGQTIEETKEQLWEAQEQLDLQEVPMTPPRIPREHDSSLFATPKSHISASPASTPGKRSAPQDQPLPAKREIRMLFPEDNVPYLESKIEILKEQEAAYRRGLKCEIFSYPPLRDETKRFYMGLIHGGRLSRDDLPDRAFTVAITKEIVRKPITEDAVTILMAYLSSGLKSYYERDETLYQGPAPRVQDIHNVDELTVREGHYRAEYIQFGLQQKTRDFMELLSEHALSAVAPPMEQFAGLVLEWQNQPRLNVASPFEEKFLLNLASYGETAISIFPPVIIPLLQGVHDTYLTKVVLGGYHYFGYPVQTPWVTFVKNSCTVALLYGWKQEEVDSTLNVSIVGTCSPAGWRTIYNALLHMTGDKVQMTHVPVTLTSKALMKMVLDLALQSEVPADLDYADEDLLSRMRSCMADPENQLVQYRPRETYIPQRERTKQFKLNSPLTRFGYTEREYADIVEPVFNEFVRFQGEAHMEHKEKINGILNTITQTCTNSTTSYVVAMFGATLILPAVNIASMFQHMESICPFEKDDIEYCFALYHKGTDEANAALADDYLRVPNPRTALSYTLFFISLKPGNVYNPSTFNGTDCSNAFIDYARAMRPMYGVAAETQFHIKHLDKTLARQLTRFKIVNWIAPEEWKKTTNTSDMNTATDQIIHLILNAKAGETFDSFQHFIPSDLLHTFVKELARFQSIFAQFVPAAQKPPIEWACRPLPRGFYPPTIRLLFDWVEQAYNNPLGPSDRRCLVLRGASGCGKTAFIDWLSQFFEVARMATSTGAYYTGITASTEIIVFDDVEQPSNYTDILTLMNPTKNVKYNIKYGHIQLKYAPRMIFCTNKNFEDLFDLYKQPEPVIMAYRRKCLEVEVGSGSFSIPEMEWSRDGEFWLKGKKCAVHCGVPRCMRFYPTEAYEANVKGLNHIDVYKQPKSKPQDTLLENHLSIKSDITMFRDANNLAVRLKEFPDLYFRLPEEVAKASPRIQLLKDAILMIYNETRLQAYQELAIKETFTDRDMRDLLQQVLEDPKCDVAPRLAQEIEDFLARL